MGHANLFPVHFHNNAKLNIIYDDRGFRNPNFAVGPALLQKQHQFNHVHRLSRGKLKENERRQLHTNIHRTMAILREASVRYFPFHRFETWETLSRI